MVIAFCNLIDKASKLSEWNYLVVQDDIYMISEEFWANYW